MSKEIVFFLVDDDADDRLIFTMALGCLHSKIECITAKDGEEALEMLKNETFTPDFIFLDLNMPRVDGKECLVQIRKMERLQKVPVYIYSTSLQEKDREETLSLGATGYFIKPYSTTALVNMFSKIIVNSYPPTVKSI
jgi:CheY-like chemotaxis protein